MSLNAIIRWFKPREIVFFDLLERSAENLCEATALFQRELAANDPSRWKGLRRQMKDFEHIGDALNRDIVDRLDQTFVTPIDREDILQLSSAVDDVIDDIDDASERLVLYRIGNIRPPVLEMADLLVEGATHLLFLMKSLRKMSNVKEIRARIRSVQLMEDRADRVYSSFLGQLFDTSGDAIELVKWKWIIENLEDASDSITHVAKLVGSTVTKNA